MKKSIQFLTVVGAIATASAQTPEPAADEDMAEVVVTGTSIRGTAPIGTQLVTLDAASIQAVGATNTADLLASMPMFNSFNIAPQGGQAQFNSGGSSTPACMVCLAPQCWCSSMDTAQWATPHCSTFQILRRFRPVRSSVLKSSRMAAQPFTGRMQSPV